MGPNVSDEIEDQQLVRVESAKFAGECARVLLHTIGTFTHYWKEGDYVEFLSIGLTGRQWLRENGHDGLEGQSSSAGHT